MHSWAWNRENADLEKNGDLKTHLGRHGDHVATVQMDKFPCIFIYPANIGEYYSVIWKYCAVLTWHLQQVCSTPGTVEKIVIFDKGSLVQVCEVI